MKRYNYLFCGIFSLYIVLAGGCTYAFISYENKVDNLFIIDMNRIMHDINNKQTLDFIDYEKYPNITKVEYLDNTVKTQEKIEAFYKITTRNVSYQPWYDKEVEKGILKFTYEDFNQPMQTLFIVVQVSLFIMIIFVMVVLVYINAKLIKPFASLKDMPYKLSQGHFKEYVKINKASYLGSFLWGMSQLKDTLQISKNRQLELEKEKKQLLLSISHDIKTPLHMIKLYAKALDEHVYDTHKDEQHAITQIGKKCDVIEAHVNDIIKHSREDILDIKVISEEFYVVDLIENILSVYQEQCDLRHLHLEIEPYENRILKGDIHRAQEVLENLFENAFKYGDGKQIRISFYEEEYCQLIRFFNSGSSVQKQESMHLFDSFYRGSNAQGITGSGLGLYICKSIMRKMDGDIFWEPSTTGTVFVLVFH